MKALRYILASVVCLSLFTSVAFASVAESGPGAIARAAEDAGKKIETALNVKDLAGLRNVALVKLSGPMADEINPIISARLSKVPGLSFGAYEPTDTGVAGEFRGWLDKYGDPSKFPQDIDERANKIIKEHYRNAKIDAVFYGEILGAQEKNGKAGVRISLKLLDLRPCDEDKTMKILWQEYVWGEFQPEAIKEMTETQKRFLGKALDEAIAKAVADLNGKSGVGDLAGVKRVIVIALADDVRGLATETLKVSLGKDNKFTSVARADSEFSPMLDEIRFNAEYGDIASVKIDTPPAGMVNMADAILIGKLISCEEADGETRVTLNLRLIKMNGDQAWAYKAEGRYRDRESAVNRYLIIGAVVLGGCIALFLITSAVGRFRKDREKEEKANRAERKAMRQKADDVSDVLRQDETLRSRIVRDLAGARQALKRAQNGAQAVGKGDEAQMVKKSVDGLDGLVRKIETASYGNVELFQAGRISDKELKSLLDFEGKMEALMKDVGVEAEAAGDATAAGDYVTLLDRLRDLDKVVEKLGAKFADRDRYIREQR